jgi:hypothetical protein
MGRQPDFDQRAFWSGARGAGITGVLEEGSGGLILGLMYLAFGRSLAVPFVACGVCDAIDTLLLFLRKYPS